MERRPYKYRASFRSRTYRRSPNTRTTTKPEFRTDEAADRACSAAASSRRWYARAAGSVSARAAYNARE